MDIGAALPQAETPQQGDRRVQACSTYAGSVHPSDRGTGVGREAQRGDSLLRIT
jgi:hypothetical protein